MIFSGVGNAFNTEMGNTSAYLRKINDLILIDCGSSVFKAMKEHKLLDNLERMSVIITHTHPDHIGSLGDLIFYANFILNFQPTIIYPEKLMMTEYLKIMGVEPHHYKLISQEDVRLSEGQFDNFCFTFYKTPHVDVIPSYGIHFNYNGDSIYYSGDSNTIPTEIRRAFLNKTIDRIYQDISSSTASNSVHLLLTQLNAFIPMAERQRVYCMHFESEAATLEVQQNGYQIVRPFNPLDSEISL